MGAPGILSAHRWPSPLRMEPGHRCPCGPAPQPRYQRLLDCAKRMREFLRRSWRPARPGTCARLRWIFSKDHIKLGGGRGQSERGRDQRGGGGGGRGRGRRGGGVRGGVGGGGGGAGWGRGAWLSALGLGALQKGFWRRPSNAEARGWAHLWLPAHPAQSTGGTSPYVAMKGLPSAAVVGGAATVRTAQELGRERR